MNTNASSNSPLRLSITLLTVCLSLSMAPQSAPALDLNRLLEGVGKNAGNIWNQRDTLLGDVSDDQELQMGRAAVAVLLSAAPPVQNKSLQDYVNRVGLWIALQSERPQIPWRFVVLDDNTVNAFAAPGGYVLITRGLFLSLRNEAELAGVLAHEIAHVIAKHHVEAMVGKARTNTLLDIAKDSTGKEGLLPDALLSASKSLYASGLDQSDEFEADRMGIALAARAGYDPYGLRHALMTLNAAESDPEIMGLFTSTHPSTGDRIGRLDQILDGSIGQLSGQVPLTRFAKAQASLR